MAPRNSIQFLAVVAPQEVSREIVLRPTSVAAGELDTPPLLQESPPFLVLIDIDIAVRVHPDGMTASGRGQSIVSGSRPPISTPNPIFAIPD
jgi:hypothetical protein